jgi:DnaK suppressor protein
MVECVHFTSGPSRRKDWMLQSQGRCPMAETKPSSDRAFIEEQRKRLEALRRELLGVEEATDAEQRADQAERGSEAQDDADSAQYATRSDVYQSLHAADAARLRRIERALGKIDEGTYGYSDLSGEPIPEARLKAAPEAILTVEEERREERRPADVAEEQNGTS